MKTDNSIREAVAGIIKNSVKHPYYAAGVEAANVWQLLGQGKPMIPEDDTIRLGLDAINRDVYLSFAEVFNYRCTIAKEVEPGVDAWRFSKHPNAS